MLQSGERQVAPTLDGIRKDHRERYTWSARFLPRGTRVIDMCCGIGYGAKILADAGHAVTAVDGDRETIAYARQHYGHERIVYGLHDANAPGILRQHKAAVAFECVEHLADPGPMLRELRRLVSCLLVSAPNEAAFPWRPEYKFHKRHYTAAQLEALLAANGWVVEKRFCQAGNESPVRAKSRGEPRTLVYVCGRGALPAPAEPRRLVEMERKPPALPVPKSVAILGLGPSLEAYVDITKRMGSRGALVEETWGINAAIDVLRCHRGFHMDDVRVQEIRAAAAPKGNIATMLPWLRRHPGPIYTSRPHPEYPGLVAYPLADVMNTCKAGPYFNSTAAYAVAYAIHIGVEEIQLWGCDFSYANSHQAERGRACVEMYLGIARARGIKIAMPAGTSLMDGTATADERLYGYDTLDLRIDYGQGDAVAVSFAERVALPTAAEIERRYDHSKPTVSPVLLAKS